MRAGRNPNMSNPMNQQSLVENIDLYLADGMPVYDTNGDKVGDVKMYSTSAGYLMVGHGAFDHDDLYVPFRRIRSIDLHDIFLSEPKDKLISNYTQPPKISTLSEERLVVGPDGALTSQKRDVQMVQSGYDGLPAIVNSVDVGAITDRLAVGMVVYDVDGERLGDISQYDIPRRLLVVEKGIFNPRVLFVPFSAIASVNREELSVYLTLPCDVIVKEHGILPADA
jgi:ribosomal 30S subunit maturation factor RimM